MFGAAVNLAARVMDRARGGQVLVTDTVREAAGTMPDARFRDRGRVALKGFPERQRLFEVRPARPPAARPARRRHPAVLAAATAVGTSRPRPPPRSWWRGGEDDVEVAREQRRDPRPGGRGRSSTRCRSACGPAISRSAAGRSGSPTSRTGPVSQIGTRSRRVVRTVSPGIAVDGLAVGPGGLWVADGGRGSCAMIDPEFHSVARSLPGRAAMQSRGLSPWAEDAVWIVAGAGSRIARLDPRTERLVETSRSATSPSDVVIGAGAVWVGDSEDGTVSRIDPRSEQGRRHDPGRAERSAIAVGRGGVWVAVPLEDRVKRIDPASNVIAESVRVPGGPAAAALGAGGDVGHQPRAPGRSRGSIPTARASTRTIRVGHSPQGVAIVDGAVWVSLQAEPGSRRRYSRRQRRGAAGAPPRAPVQHGSRVDWWREQVLAATCALLVNYPDKPFPAGAKLVPEVARELPTVSDDGRTYTFRLRSGFRFSPPSDAPVTAEAFRRAIERRSTRKPSPSPRTGT